MKRTIASIALPLALLCAGAFAQTAATPSAAAPAAAAPAATAAPAGPSKIGIINIQQAIALTNEGKRDIEGLEKKFDPKRQELQGLNKEVEDLKKQLDSQGSKLNEEARSNLVKSIESKQKTPAAPGRRCAERLPGPAAGTGESRWHEADGSAGQVRKGERLQHDHRRVGSTEPDFVGTAQRRCNAAGRRGLQCHFSDHCTGCTPGNGIVESEAGSTFRFDSEIAIATEWT